MTSKRNIQFTDAQIEAIINDAKALGQIDDAPDLSLWAKRALFTLVVAGLSLLVFFNAEEIVRWWHG